MRKTPRPLDETDIKRLLLDEIKKASGMLLRKKAVLDESVHSARKMLKRARAKLRLLRDAVGGSRFSVANAGLRDAARAFAALRDGKVMLEMTKQFLLREKNPGCRESLVELQRALQRARTRALSEGFIEESSWAIDRVARRIERWKVSESGYGRLRKSMTRIYCNGRQALRAVHSNCSNEALHELRKQTKYFGSALKLLGHNHSSAFKPLIRRADVIAKALGDDHDLFMMQRHMRAPDRAAGKQCEDLDIKRHRKVLQKKALTQGAHLYKYSRKEFGKILMLGRASATNSVPGPVAKR